MGRLNCFKAIVALAVAYLSVGAGISPVAAYAATGTDPQLIAGTLPDGQGDDPAEGDVRLGMRLVSVDNDLMENEGLLSDFGLYVTSVTRSGPAAKAGIAAGDVVVMADRLDVMAIDDLDWVLESLKGEGSVQIGIESNRKYRTVEVELSGLASDSPDQTDRVTAILGSRGVRQSRAAYHPPTGGAAPAAASGEAPSAGGGAGESAASASVPTAGPAAASATAAAPAEGVPAQGNPSDDGHASATAAAAATAAAVLAAAAAAAGALFGRRRKNDCPVPPGK